MDTQARLKNLVDLERVKATAALLEGAFDEEGDTFEQEHLEIALVEWLEAIVEDLLDEVQYHLLKRGWKLDYFEEQLLKVRATSRENTTPHYSPDTRIAITTAGREALKDSRIS